MPSLTCEFHLLFFLCVLIESCQPFNNDATEIVNLNFDYAAQETPNNISLNRPRNGGMPFDNSQRSDQRHLGCRELRSTKYISDGQCTSLNPVKELVCAGECLPSSMSPNWIGGGYGSKFWARRDVPGWRCVNDRTRTQRVRLQCQDGSSRTYRVTVVTSCKCKRCSRQHNDSGRKAERRASSSRPQGHQAAGRKPKNGHQEGWRVSKPKTQVLSTVGA